MNEKDLEQTHALIARDFELDATGSSMTEEQLLDLLADRIAWLIEYRMEFLLSLMYRLDVPEANVNAALSPAHPEPANLALAKLVLERQKARIRTKREYRQDNLDGWDWE